MRRVTYLKLSARDSQRFRIPLIPVILGCLNLYLPAMKCHYCGRPAGLIRLRCPACKTRLIQWYLVTGCFTNRRLLRWISAARFGDLVAARNVYGALDGAHVY